MPTDYRSLHSAGAIGILPWQWNSGASFYPCRSVEGSWAFAHLVYMCFADLEKAFNPHQSSVRSPGSYCGSMGMRQLVLTLDLTHSLL